MVEKYSYFKTYLARPPGRPYRLRDPTADDGARHTPPDTFSILDISTVGTVLVPKSLALEHLAESFPKTYVSFGIGTLLVVEQSSLEKAPQGGETYTVVNGNPNPNPNPKS